MYNYNPLKGNHNCSNASIAVGHNSQRAGRKNGIEF